MLISREICLFMHGLDYNKNLFGETNTSNSMYGMLEQLIILFFYHGYMALKITALNFISIQQFEKTFKFWNCMYFRLKHNTNLH